MSILHVLSNYDILQIHFIRMPIILRMNKDDKFLRTPGVDVTANFLVADHNLNTRRNVSHNCGRTTSHGGNYNFRVLHNTTTYAFNCSFTAVQMHGCD